MKQHRHAPRTKSEKVPSTVKLVLVLCVLLIGLLVSQQQQRPQQHPSSSLRHDNNGNDHDVAVISTKETNSTDDTPPTILAEVQSSSSTTSPVTKPRWFTCGFDLWNLGPELFDDLELVGRFGETISATKRDVLLQGGLNGPCQQSPTDFPGKVLFVNSESRTDADKYLLQDRFFQLGPMDHTSATNDATSRALPKVTFGAIFFVAATTAEQRQWILDPIQRPQGIAEKRNAIVMLVNRCGGLRKQVAMEIAESTNMTMHQNPKCQTKKSPSNFHAIPKEDWTPRHQYRENFQLYAKYKYCLVLENTNAVPDYLTEKLLLAFLGGCLPIYSGSRNMALNIFGKNALVWYDPEAPEQALTELEYLQSNASAYDEKMTHPILAHGMESANEYLSLAKDVGDGRLRSKIRSMLGIE